MKKIYKNPTTTVYEIKLRDLILQSGSSKPIDETPGTEDIEVPDAREYNSTDNNSGKSVWDEW